MCQTDRVKPSFVILTSGHSGAQPWTSECPDVKNYKWLLNPVGLAHDALAVPMTTMGVKGLGPNIGKNNVSE